MADYSAEYKERWASLKVADYLRRLVPRAAERKEVCRFLSASIRAAAQAAPSRWGLTRKAEAIRLNVGPAEAALVADGYLLLMLDRATVKSSGAARSVAALPKSGAKDYRSVPGSVYVQVEYENAAQLRDTLRLLWTAHEKHVFGAGALGLNGATRKGHDPLLVEQVAAEAGETLPQPAYVTVSRPTSLEDNRPRDTPHLIPEGAPSKTIQTARERNSEARRLCIAHYGARCSVCGIAFEEVSGPIAAGCIHVPHLVELAEGRRATDPIRDLRPVCPNCHLVIHLTTPAMAIEAAQKLVSSQKDV